MYESALERRLVSYVRSIGGRAFKWVSPGQVGVPDRICILPGGRIIFVELKAPGRADGRSPAQVKMFGTLRGLGCDVRLISAPQQIQELIDEI